MTRNYLLQKIQKKETGKRLTQEALLKNQNKRLKRVLQKNNVQKLFECLNKLFMEKEKNENPGHDSHDFQNKSKIIDFEKSKSLLSEMRGIITSLEKVEADFRFSLMRIRERRDEVSMLNGSKAEMKFLDHNIVEIIKNYKKIIYRNIYVNGFQNIFLKKLVLI